MPFLSVDRPPAGDRIANYYRQRGLRGPALRQETGTVIGTFATVESVAVGFQWGLRFQSSQTDTAAGMGNEVPILGKFPS